MFYLLSKDDDHIHEEALWIPEAPEIWSVSNQCCAAYLNLSESRGSANGRERPNAASLICHLCRLQSQQHMGGQVSWFILTVDGVAGQTEPFHRQRPRGAVAI